VQVLLATDAQWLVDDVVAALGGPDTSFTVCSDGRRVSPTIAARAKDGEVFDIGIFDLQVGSMGGMAVTMALRLDASAGTTPDLPVLMLLDRAADVHLARRSGADGWLIKPLDPLRLRRAVRTILAGGSVTEGLPAAPPPVETDPADGADDGTEPAGAEPVASG
jgi:DNA-binding response OmpR family regulator